MENKDTNTEYQKFVRVGDKKWELIEITIKIFFFCLRFLFTIFHTWKESPQPKVPIPTQNPDLTYVSPVKEFWKMAQPPPAPTSPGEWMVGMHLSKQSYQCLFLNRD